MAIGIVTSVTLNVKKTFKNGKTFDGSELCFNTDKGAQKKEFVFAKAPFTSVLGTLAPGDKIDATYTKNGEYFNLTDVKLIEKGTGVAPEKPAFGGGQKGGGGSYQESPEKQASIQRQNALTNAVSLVGTCVEQGLYKKTTTPDIVLQETLRIAKEFAAFSAGTLQIEELKVDLSGIKTDAPPFSMGEEDEFGA